jgi:hypothetical protein
MSQIPGSIRAEHESIHSSLTEATKAPGRVGAAARALADVLHSHFVREEEIALPPLGMLARVASDSAIPAPEVSRVVTMTDSLERELPQMLQEHRAIEAAIVTLRTTAEEERSSEIVRLADQLALHARTEEEVLYPAAIVLGRLLKSRYPDCSLERPYRKTVSSGA